MGRDEFIRDKVVSILERENSFLSLKEIYNIYVTEVDGDLEKYGTENIESEVRRAIYHRCLDRDMMIKKEEPLFVSTLPKKTHGNKYGLAKWIQEDNAQIDLIVDRFADYFEEDDEINIAPSKEIRKNVVYIVRRKCMMQKAIKRANYMCEYDPSHLSFIRKTNNKNYTEAHHLIPLSNQDEFEYSLDIPENIISLCSNCHNLLHYGLDKEKILRKLYEERIEGLRNKKIDITFDKLLEYYD